MRPPTGISNDAAGESAVKPAWPARLLLALALATAAVGLFATGRGRATADSLALLLAAFASVAIVARTLPLQSVLFAAFITAGIGGAAHGLSTKTGLPFGPVSFGEPGGPQIFNCVSWTVPFLWVVAVFNSRGAARLILRPWRKAKSYGFRLIGLTTALALGFDFALEPFARARHLWFWHPTKISATWFGASPLNTVSWAFVTGVILAVITPFLIRKQPGQTSAPDFAPPVLWLGAVALFGAGAAEAQLWPAVAMDAIFAAVVAVLCWRGAKW